MSKKDVNFEWYVLNEDHNARVIAPFNIFNNIKIYEGTIDLCKKYKTKKMTLEQFTEELRSIIQWQLWSRCQYEVVVQPLLDSGNPRKVDCYDQVLPNINILAKYVLTTYYPKIEFTSTKKSTKKVEKKLVGTKPETFMTNRYRCPKCKRILKTGADRCPNCSEIFDWS